ncbi:MAG: GH92 family glycosyl hydrolase [Rikenellaceae bacterium]
MKKLNFTALLLPLLVVGCADLETDYTQYVDPFIGTGGHGHTFPGATVPNGMVQLSPDTRLLGWDACSGYHYSDNTIIGFSHTHLSGTGIGDYGDILLMPMAGQIFTECGDEDAPQSGYRSLFSHEDESASPGYYSVELKDDGIFAELTATTRVGMHRYQFPQSDDAAIIIDLAHSLQGHRNVEMSLSVISDTEIEGYKITRGWAKMQPVYFYAKFNKPFTAEIYKGGSLQSGTSAQGENLKALLRFATSKDEQVIAKVAISAVDNQGARGNMEAEVSGWDFDAVVTDAAALWNERLSKIDVQTQSLDDKTIFYSAMYHSAISPNTFIDVDGRYLGQDLQIHQAPAGENYYTVYSLWDTFRAQHPLLSIIDPQLNAEFAANLVRKYEEGGCLPKWDLWSNYTGTMTGYHAVSVICEAYLKGARTFDAEKAFEACVHSSTYHPIEASFIDGAISTGALMPKSKLYKETLGYIPSDLENESVANALEYAYSDWCIAQFAKALGKDAEYAAYMKRSKYYANYFDAETGFMRGKLENGEWREPFDPRASNHRKDDYCEGNAWQWSWYVPHDINGLVELHGSVEQFTSKLDSLFSVSSELVGEQISGDISGLVGQYAHGNEPSHHITHIYNYVGQAWKCQELVDHILYDLYFNDPNGLAGNEDCGQMSAWYILNSIGLYSVAPASGEYSFGRPIFDKVSIPLDGGKALTISTINNSRENKYIQSIKVNGELQNSTIITYETLMGGAQIEIVMGPEPVISNI